MEPVRKRYMNYVASESACATALRGDRGTLFKLCGMPADASDEQLASMLIGRLTPLIQKGCPILPGYSVEKLAEFVDSFLGGVNSFLEFVKTMPPILDDEKEFCMLRKEADRARKFMYISSNKAMGPHGFCDTVRRVDLLVALYRDMGDVSGLIMTILGATNEVVIDNPVLTMFRQCLEKRGDKAVESKGLTYATIAGYYPTISVSVGLLNSLAKKKRAEIGDDMLRFVGWICKESKFTIHNFRDAGESMTQYVALVTLFVQWKALPPPVRRERKH